MAYQLPIDKYEYDTIHGKAKQTVEIDGDFLVLDGKKLLTSRCRDPKEVGWGALGADYVCQCTGVFLARSPYSPFYSAPAKDDTQTIVMGVNQEEEYDGSADFISCASCTTNGLAPMVKAIHKTSTLLRRTS